MMATMAHQDALSTTVESSDSEDNLSSYGGELQCKGDLITSCTQAKLGKVDDAVMQYGRHFAQTVCKNDLFAIESLPWNSKALRQCPTSDEDVKVAFLKEIEPMTTRETQAKATPASAERRRHYRFKDVASNSDSKEEDSDGEIFSICQKCSLPLGNLRFRHEDGTCGLEFHAECMAQVSAARMEKANADTVELDRQEKEERRKAHSIGWDVKHIPRNTTAASKLVTHQVPQGMMCLVLNEDAGSVSVASTLLPSAAINLEYLSTALKVRRREGHEPIFSLEPVEGECESRREGDAMQKKVYLPEWLAGTSVGEVLFQADYHLKELSMGECGKPVVGMKSCFDLADSDLPWEWCAREWFLVRKAEMQIIGNNALVPYVKMGVEAREQIMSGNNLVDKLITIPDHPMVKFAESFTRNFDLVAERRSVIYHLRELAKASVMAKFLLDSKVHLEESWFHLSASKDIPCSLELPQTWSKRVRGKVLDLGKGQTTQAQMHSVFGGVNFGLSKFTLSGRVTKKPSLQVAITPALSGSAIVPAEKQAPMPIGKLGMGGTTTLSKLSGLLPANGAVEGLLLAKGVIPKGLLTVGGNLEIKTPSGLVPSTSLSRSLMAPASGAPPGMTSLADHRMPTFSPPRASLSAVSAPRLSPGALSAAFATPRLSAQLSPPVFAAGAMPLIQGLAALEGPPGVQSVKPEGVDLRLDNFDLSQAVRHPELEHSSLETDVKPLDESVAIGDAFWSSLEDDANKLFNTEDRDLLRKIFNPTLSDRRAEGELFCPPDVRLSYVSKLRALVKEEDSLRRLRKEAFFSEKFAVSNPGEIFPASWTPSVTALAAGDVPIRSLDHGRVLTARPEFEELATELLETRLKVTAPIFDRATEEETRFRIYHIGSLEVRTVKESTSPEIVGAVFSIRHATFSLCRSTSQRDDIPVMEKIVKATQYVEHVLDEDGNAKSRRRFFLVIETESGHKICTERLKDRAVTWDENPNGLEERNALARVMQIAGCRAGCVVRDLKSYQSTVSGGAADSGAASPSACKRYVRTAFSRIVAAESRS